MNKNKTPTQLDPLSFPLTGSRLIEASAGTGKTFTIALLYVRLVLGAPEPVTDNNTETAIPPLTPKQILVVTFTELAAGELRDRIRARLVEAAEYFLQQEKQDDPLLVELRAQYPQQHWPSYAWRLQAASQSMDEASIATIHSWCNRMLLEHAFDTRGLFNREMVTDSSELLSQVVQDYWRQHYYQFELAQAAQLMRLFATPAALQHRLKPLLNPNNQGISYQGQPIAADFELLLSCLQQLAKIEQQQQAAETAAKAHWAANWDSIKQQLMELRPHLNGTKHNSASEEKFLSLLDEIHQWAQGNGPEPTKLTNFASGNFSFKKGAKIQEEPALEAFDLLNQLNSVREQQPSYHLEALALAHAGAWVRHEFAQRLQQQAQMGFDDLLVQLERALDPEHGKEQAEHLANNLRQLFPVAMIDEFQDTDPIQYSIFNRIYQIKVNRPDCGIFMIGDPKQSIYAFRGADIHTYLHAKQNTTGRHYTLKKNFRSTKQVVAACNAFFQFAEQHTNGAFRYRSEDDDPVPFVEVDAHGQQQQLVIEQQQVNPLTLWYFDSQEPDKPLARKDYHHQAALTAASEIARWLSSAQQGTSGFAAVESKQVERPLQAADIAVLVRSGTEAKLISQALASHNIPSVYLSDRESIFSSQQAADCLRWLQACAEPNNEQLVRAALGSLSLAIPLSQLAAWQEDELEREQQMLVFGRMRDIWRQQGVMVMLQRLQEHYQLPQRLMQQHDGERILTNLLHLGEWLQTAASQLDGEQALIRHLAEQLDTNDQQHLLRLESDAQRIKILTIHKSKGLEFKLVVLPFISSWLQIPQTSTNYRNQHKLYTEIANKNSFAQAWQQADEEELKEQLRLLYVALTRASYAIWLGLGPLAYAATTKKIELDKSAMGYILNGDNAFKDAEEVWQQAEQLAQQPYISLIKAPAHNQIQVASTTSTQLGQARAVPQLGNLHNWWIASYSALSFAGQTPASQIQLEPATAREDQLIDSALDEHITLSASQAEDPNSLHQFPRGASWGTFLHGLLEWAAQTNYHSQQQHLEAFAAAVADDHGRDLVLTRRCQLRHIEPQAQQLSAWLKEFCLQPWPQGFALVDLAAGQLAVELEFLLELHQVNAQELDQLISSHTQGNNYGPPATYKLLNGMLKGFIDLVIEHQGRYYIVDWKSNYLGGDDASYSQAAMQQAIYRHRYDVQYMLYILALHRHLKVRLPDYDYQQHMGGAIYSFLRGWKNPNSQGLFHDLPPKQVIEQLDQLFSTGISS